MLTCVKLSHLNVQLVCSYLSRFLHQSRPPQVATSTNIQSVPEHPCATPDSTITITCSRYMLQLRNTLQLHVPDTCYSYATHYNYMLQIHVTVPQHITITCYRYMLQFRNTLQLHVTDTCYSYTTHCNYMFQIHVTVTQHITITCSRYMLQLRNTLQLHVPDTCYSCATHYNYMFQIHVTVT